MNEEVEEVEEMEDCEIVSSGGCVGSDETFLYV
jgi:hypothetical protein